MKSASITKWLVLRSSYLWAKADQVLTNPTRKFRLESAALTKSKLRDIGLRLEHYIVSGGIAELIRGLKIAPYMTEIFGCEFEQTRVHNMVPLLSWPNPYEV